MHPDEKKNEAMKLLRSAVAYYGALGSTIKRLLTHNGSAFRSRQSAIARTALGIRHRFTRAYRPQTNVRANSIDCAQGARLMAEKRDVVEPQIVSLRKVSKVLVREQQGLEERAARRNIPGSYGPGRTR